MPKKGSKNDHVSLVRSRLPQIANLSREKIELALLYYDSDVDATVQAFERGKNKIEKFYFFYFRVVFRRRH